MPDVQPELVEGLIDGIADGKYDILQDLITLSKDYATKAIVREEAFHRAFSMIPQSEREKLLDEASKKYGISRGESKVTARYSQAQEKQIQYSLKAVELLQSDKAKEVFAKGAKNGWTLDKVLDEIGGFGNRTGYKNLFTEEQLNSNVKNLDREQLALDIASNYSYTVEINTSVEPPVPQEHLDDGLIPTQEYLDMVGKPTQHYSNLTVPGGTNGSYIEANIETPLITPSIKGHSQFSTDTSIGWYRMDEKQQYQEKDIENLIEIMKKNSILEVNCN